MEPQTTGSADASGDSGQPDYQAKYNGLNAAFQRRVNEFTAKETAWETERQALEAKAAKVAEYEAREAAEREEAEAQAQYEQLRERFATQPPAPQNPNATNHTARHDDAGWQDRYGERKPAAKQSDATGWPV